MGPSILVITEQVRLPVKAVTPRILRPLCHILTRPHMHPTARAVIRVDSEEKEITSVEKMVPFLRTGTVVAVAEAVIKLMMMVFN